MLWKWFSQAEEAGIEVVIESLKNMPSVPGPLYFTEGLRKVTNASNPFTSAICFRPEGAILVCLVVRRSPSPSKSIHPGDSTYFGGRSGTGTVQLANRLLP